MTEQIEFFNEQTSKKHRLKLLKDELYLLEKDIEKSKAQYQQNTKNINFNELLIDYLKTNPKWISDYLGEYLIEVKNNKLIFVLSNTFINTDLIKTEYGYLNPYLLGDMLSDNFAARSDYWYSKPHKPNTYKLSKWATYDVFNKIELTLHD